MQPAWGNKRSGTAPTLNQARLVKVHHRLARGHAANAERRCDFGLGRERASGRKGPALLGEPLLDLSVSG
jgi:hypothetical protein